MCAVQKNWAPQFAGQIASNKTMADTATTETVDWSFFPYIAVLVTEDGDKNLEKFIERASHPQVGLPVQRLHVHVWHRVQTTNIVELENAVARNHQAIIKDAFDQGYENVLVFEDDAAFDHDYSIATINKTIQYLKTHPWDMFFLGQLPLGPMVPIQESLVLASAPLEAHAYAVHRQCMPTVLEHHFDFLQIDFYYASLLNKRKYALFPSYSYQSVPPKQTPAFVRGFEHRKVHQFMESVFWIVSLFVLLVVLTLCANLGFKVFASGKGSTTRRDLAEITV